MSDLVKIARQRISPVVSTHWEGCERDHIDCLIQRMADEIERLRAALTEANAQTERFEREWYLRGDEIEQLRAERNVEWSRNERATRLLSEIYKLMNPPVFAVDGKRLTFNPPGGALSALQSLSDRIRALPDELDAIDAAMKEQK